MSRLTLTALCLFALVVCSSSIRLPSKVITSNVREDAVKKSAKNVFHIPFKTTRSSTVALDGTFSQFYMYWTTASVGTPGVSFTVTVDTGSSDFLIPDKGCTTCAGNPKDFYDVTQSSTGTTISCQAAAQQGVKCAKCQDNICLLSTDYGGSILEESYLASDIVTIGDFTTKAQFGAVYNVSMTQPPSAEEDRTLPRPIAARRIAARNARASADQPQPPEGMFGLAFQQLSSGDELGPMDAYVKAGLMEDVFGMCIGQVGGVLSLGSPLPLEGSADYVYTPITKPSFYTVSMSELQVGGVTVPVPTSTYNLTIVDSGTPWPNVPQNAFVAMKKLFFDLCEQGVALKGICADLAPGNKTIFDQECFQLSESDVAMYPNVSFVLSPIAGSSTPVALDFVPQHYLQPQYYCTAPGSVGIGISGDEQFTVIGAEMLQQYAVAYDRGNMRVGFSTAKSSACPQ